MRLSSLFSAFFPGLSAGSRSGLFLKPRVWLLLPAISLLLAAPLCRATDLANVHGIVHDPQHFPLKNATVTLGAADSAYTRNAVTDSGGGFTLTSVPIGVYRLSVQAKGFAEYNTVLTIQSSTNPVIHIALAVAGPKENLNVQDSLASVDSVTPTTMVSERDIEQTPGAGRTNGMEMVTDYVPGAYMTHDMLHMRGGHQTSWLLDGISIPNTKIASNLGPQIDPKDIGELETQRGSYASDLGDRTYGVFNVLPRNGFERDRQGELLVSLGNFDTGESELSLGDHSAKTAWYASLTGSRSNYGLATPVAQVLHDATNSQSGFVSVIRNQTPKDQLRLTGQYREDYFQIPYDPNPNDWEQASGYYESYGLRDGQTERDSFAIANWVHTLSPKAVWQVAPFYHFNQANLDSPSTDFPVATTWHQTSNYAGAQGDLRADVGRNNFSGGFYSFYQAESDLYGLVINDQSFAAGSLPNTTSTANAGLVEEYISDHLRVDRWITLLGGMRFSQYWGGFTEQANYPRLGATVEIPKLHWVFRGFYGHFFQPAPIETVSNQFLQYVTNQPGENAFVKLPSERDEEHQFGVLIPYKGWTLDIDTVKNRVNNFLDHSNVGESSVFFPIAVDGALIRAWELTLRSPSLGRYGQFHLTYSNQIAEQRGNIIGGFACSIATDPACDLGPQYISLDHDQRDTLNTGFTANLPQSIWFSTNVYYGTGFSNGLAGANEGPYNGPYLPVHTTFDVSAGHSFGERWKLSANVINATNHRVLLDNSITVGGFHFNDPRLISAGLKYRFHF